MGVFGGKMTHDANWPDGANPLYAYTNFNDFASALFTLWYLLCVNNWFVVMDAVAALASDWSRLYFLSWYALAVVVMSNLIVAHVIDGFFDQALLRTETDVEHGEAAKDDDAAEEREGGDDVDDVARGATPSSESVHPSAVEAEGSGAGEEQRQGE